MELKYFNGRGAAETTRLILAIAEKEYTDYRFKSFEDWPAAKASGEFKMNMHRAPVLVLGDGTTIGQSRVIERYLARKFGLMGEGETQEALVDCLAENARDVAEAQYKKGFSMFVKDKTDEEKVILKKEWFETDMPVMLGNLEESVASTSENEGFAVGSKLTYADVVIFRLLKDGMESDKEDTTKAAEKCPTLNAIADNVAANPKVAKWIKERPETMF